MMRNWLLHGSNENGGYLVCAKHHQTGAPSAADLTEENDGR